MSDADWKKVTSAEKWPVGVVAHHVAEAHASIGGLVHLVSFLGAHLSRSGSEVAALARGATAAALRAHGFRLEQAGALVTAPVRVVEDTAGLGEQDLVLLAVKGPSHALLGLIRVYSEAHHG